MRLANQRAEKKLKEQCEAEEESSQSMKCALGPRRADWKRLLQHRTPREGKERQEGSSNRRNARSEEPRRRLLISRFPSGQQACRAVCHSLPFWRASESRTHFGESLQTSRSRSRRLARKRRFQRREEREKNGIRSSRARHNEGSLTRCPKSEIRFPTCRRLSHEFALDERMVARKAATCNSFLTSRRTRLCS